MKKIYTARDPVDAEFMRGLLKADGIDAVVQGASLSAAIGELPLTIDTSPSVWVSADDFETARRFVLEHQGPADPSRCLNCGHNLAGLPEPRCPECGQPFNRPTRGESWVCSQCGETVEAQFTQCWNCGADADTDP